VRVTSSPRARASSLSRSLTRLAAENLALFIERKALGIRPAIDDFGTGYSSLSYLRRFPFDILKIDKSFVDGVAGGGTDVAFARTLIALGGMLELRVLAEVIEHDNQLAMLKELGCEYGQGYLFAKPLDTAAMTVRLGAKRRTPRIRRSRILQGRCPLAPEKPAIIHNGSW
jgi:EAL domain-containing protein (putative c-di-GMP-specific phosphodiesterase class I)